MSIKTDNMMELARYREKLYRNPVLKSLFFELTDCCNLSCLHCGSSCLPENSTFLNKEYIFKALDSVKRHYGTDTTMVCLTGGEPLLHPDFFEIIRFIDDSGFRWGMTTNATLIDSAAAEKIASAHMMSVSFSLDGTKEQHNYLRQNKSAFDLCVEGIYNLQKYKSSFVSMITTVVHKQNISLLDDIFKIVHSLKTDIWRLVNVDPIGKSEQSDLLLSSEEYKYLFDYIGKKRFEPSSNLNVTYGCAHYLTENYENMLRDGYFLCGSGIYVGSVLCNGDIYSCVDVERISELVQGNVAVDDFVDVWENRFQVFRQDRTQLNEACRRCKERDYCAGDAAHTWDYKTNQPKICLKNIL